MIKRLLFALSCLALPVTAFAATGTLTPSPFFYAMDANMDPISGGKLCSYLAGTSTPVNTYSDVGLSVSQNPAIADSAGKATVYLTPGVSYKFILLTAGSDTTCSTGTTVWTQDNIAAVPASASALDVLGTAGETITAGQAVYLSDGSNSKTAGLWYKADASNAYSSSRAITGMAPSAITISTSGTIRLGGQVTGLTVTTGLTYYVSTTPGSLTATAPANVRAMGVADSTSSLILIAGQPTQALPVDNGLNDFRLTLTTGVPVTTSDVTAATTIYLTPYKGNRIALYDASGNPTIYTSAEISIAVPATTTQMYDIWAYANSSGAPTLELLAWSSDTTRATAIVTTTTGAYAKSGDLTRRYLGSFRTTGVSGQTEDSVTKRYLWNYYHRIARPLRVADATDSWTYSTATWRQARASSANQVEFVVGVAETVLSLTVIGSYSADTVGAFNLNGIGLDSTSAQATGFLASDMRSQVANVHVGTIGTLVTQPTVGYHYAAWLEYGSAAGTTTWYGDFGNPTQMQSGLMGDLF